MSREPQIPVRYTGPATDEDLANVARQLGVDVELLKANRYDLEGRNQGRFDGASAGGQDFSNRGRR